MSFSPAYHKMQLRHVHSLSRIKFRIVVYYAMAAMLDCRSIIWMYTAPGAYLDMLLEHCAF